MRSFFVRFLATTTVVFLFSACELLTPKTDPGPTYLSAPDVGKASDLPDTGATTSISGSTPENAAAAEALFNSAVGVSLDVIYASIPSSPAPATQNTLSTLTKGLFQDLRAQVASAPFSPMAAGRAVLGGSKTPTNVTFDVLGSDQSKLGTGSYYSLEFLETSPEADAFSDDVQSQDMSRISKWYNKTLRNYLTTQMRRRLGGDLQFFASNGTSTLTIRSKTSQTAEIQFNVDLNVPSSMAEDLTYRANGLLDTAVGYAVSVKRDNGDGTSLGGKFIVSFASHFPFSGITGSNSDLMPTMELRFTLWGYNDDDELVFSKTYSETMGGPSS